MNSLVLNSRAKRIIYLVLVVGLLFMLPTLNLSTQNEDIDKEHKNTLMAFHRAEAARDYEAIEVLLTEDFARHSMATPDAVIESRDAYIEFLKETAELFPDYETKPERLVSDGNYLAFYSMFKGTFAGNGNVISMPIAGLVHFEDGLIDEMWLEWDNVAWEAQMFAEPEPVATMDDVVGVWEIWVNYQPWRLEWAADGTAHIGISAKQPDYVETGIFEVDGNVLTAKTDGADCEATYEVMVARQPDGKVSTLTFTLVGEECQESRQEALDGKTLIHWNRDWLP